MSEVPPRRQERPLHLLALSRGVPGGGGVLVEGVRHGGWREHDGWGGGGTGTPSPARTLSASSSSNYRGSWLVRNCPPPLWGINVDTTGYEPSEIATCW